MKSIICFLLLFVISVYANVDGINNAHRVLATDKDELMKQDCGTKKDCPTIKCGKDPSASIGCGVGNKCGNDDNKKKLTKIPAKNNTLSCNKKTCSVGKYCCNKSCSICSKIGKGCNKKLCLNPDDPTKVLLIPCGTVTCTNGTICCNALCGTCTKPNVTCTMGCTSLVDNEININSTLLTPINNNNSSSNDNSNNTFDSVQVFTGLGGNCSGTIKCMSTFCHIPPCPQMSCVNSTCQLPAQCSDC